MGLILPRGFRGVAATRHLAAIMFTDMVGYTASTQTNEARTLDLIRQQAELVRTQLGTHQGREIKSTGDGFLVEFDSALKATHCAMDIQRRIYERNAEGVLTPIQIRVGIHLGDVVESGGDILGDAVNIAARIQPVAEPGGICVSGAVREEIWNKIPEKLEKLPPTALKGVQISTDIYRVVLPWTLTTPPSANRGPTGLAVLPFTNISPDPKDEYIADGLTEELIAVLSQIRQLRVIARTSVTAYKSTSKGVSQIGAELGVSSILEGSVRKAGNRLRITAQLIDVGTQGHVWASTYDRELDDVFAIQAEISKQVAGALKIELRTAEGRRLEETRPVRPDSYLVYLKGRTLFSRGLRDQAKEQFELAISLDPDSAAAHSGLADVVQMLRLAHQGRPLAASGKTGRALVDRAIELDPNSAEAHTALGLILWCDFEYAEAEKETKLALSLNPSYSWAHLQYASLLEDEGRIEEAIVEHELAVGTDPLSPANLGSFARLLIWLGRLDEALVKIRKLGEFGGFGTGYHDLLSRYHLARGDLPACLEELHRRGELEAEPNAKAFCLAWAHALSGEKEQSRALLRQLETLPPIPITDLNVAYVYAELGDLDGCFRLLETRVTDRFIPFQQWRLDPRLQHVRSDPRFHLMLEKMNLA